MTRYNRLQAAIDGHTPDQIPVSAWFHFGSEHLDPAAVARLHADFQAAYGWDFLKVMFDYRLSYPDLVDQGEHVDLSLMLEKTDWSEPFRRQREVLEILCSTMGPEVPIVETIYSPWMYLVRHVGRDLVEQARHHPHELGEVLARLTDETCTHVRKLKEIGCFGLYFATLAADLVLSPSDIGVDSDKQVLSEGAGVVRMLHLHGSNLDATRVKQYPRDVLHWEDRAPGNPNLSQHRADNVCLMGGLPSSSLTSVSMAELRSQVRDANDEAGTAGLIIAPGCSVSPSLASRKMMALRDPDLLRT